MALQVSDLGLSEDGKVSPVRTALGRAFVQRFNSAMEAIERAKAAAEIPTRDQDSLEAGRQAAEGALGEATKMLEDVEELLDWLLGPEKPVGIPEAAAVALKATDLSLNDAAAVFLRLQKRSVGRPHKRDLFVDAFDLQLTSKDMSLGKVTRKLCRCGSEHTSRCQENLRAGIRSLKVVLRRYAPELVTQYEVLHPDRAKKVNG